MEYLSIGEQIQTYRAWIQYSEMRLDTLIELDRKRSLSDAETEEVYRLEQMQRFAIDAIHRLTLNANWVVDTV